MTLSKIFKFMAKKKEIEVQEVIVEAPVISTGCFHCKRDTTEFKCAKGDSNQFKFCSITCFNADVA